LTGDLEAATNYFGDATNIITNLANIDIYNYREYPEGETVSPVGVWFGYPNSI